MTDAAVEAYRSMRRWERISNRYAQDREMKLASAALGTAMAAEKGFRTALPSTWRGILLKARQAVHYLAKSQDTAAQAMIRDFFRKPRQPIDGEWIAELRILIDRVQHYGIEPQKAVECLQSIVKGVASLRSTEGPLTY